MLSFPPNYSDYRSGQLFLGIWPLLFFSFLILLANGGEMGKKVDFEGRLA